MKRCDLGARLRAVAALVGTLSALWPAIALAAGTNMPWEQPLQQILDSVQGPVVKIIAVIIIIITGLTLAFGETSGGFRRLIQIVFGISIAFAASTFFMTFFNFAGGALVS
jgi:type IV secretion system protein VirB2